ncbi:MAG: hypothetical protein LQ342_008066 [Letrouitia transgressa]|nr:MAG: hypothetical protein LQ342_008066 [Letrouitia transgressa]
MEELGIEYQPMLEDMISVKEEKYQKLNPNGRCPTIEDPNTGITLWESGAIIEYIIDQYDTEHKISFESFPEKYHTKQYLYYQCSGQGPYFGQAAWFSMYHHEDVPSARDRYRGELRRIIKVLDGVLSDKEYLVGGKCSYADLSFLTWCNIAPGILGADAEEVKQENPHYAAWMGRLLARPAVQKTLKDKERLAPPDKKYKLDHRVDEEEQKAIVEKTMRCSGATGCSAAASTAVQ